MTRQEENNRMLELIKRYKQEGKKEDVLQTIILADISKSLAVIADAADIIKSKIKNRF